MSTQHTRDPVSSLEQSRQGGILITSAADEDELGQGQLLVQHHVAVSGNSGNLCCDCDQHPGLLFPKTRALSFYNSATHPTAYRLLPEASLKMVAPLSGTKEKNSEPVSISELRPCAETSFAASSPSSVWRGLRSWLSAWPLASHQSGLCFSS